MDKGSPVLIIGAGPSGVLLALLLARQSIPVIVLEKELQFSNQPRASFYGSTVINVMREAGILDDVLSKAYRATGIAWRWPDGTRLCGIDAARIPEEARQISLPLDELIPLIARHLEKCPSAEIRMGWEVTSLGQDETKAWVDIKDHGRVEARYIVGCDGGTSKVRREIFGEKNFPGRTWDRQIVATNVYYPRFKDYNWPTANFFVSKEHHSMIAQMTNDGLLRITYGEDGNLTREDMLARQPDKFKSFVPGKPEPDEYTIVNFSPYRIHQRCAERLRVGRVLLAADAAHLCNPYGGLGLTGGFADVSGLYQCLYGIYAGKADESVLDKYDEIRREKYWSIIDAGSTANLNRLMNSDPEIVESDKFFDLLKQAEADESGQINREMALSSNDVLHDFTQYYSGT